MALAAGLFVVLAVAASAAGWWLLAALPLAGALAWAGGVGADAPEGRVAHALAAARAWCLLALCASVPAAYVAPELRSVASTQVAYVVVALVVVLVVTGADATGARLPARVPRWVAGLGVLVLAAFVAVCVAIDPAGPTIGATEPPTPVGLLVAVVVLTPLFAELRGVALGVGVGVATVLSAAVLYQLGPFRLGLSVTSMRDVLVAADASALTSLLVVVAVGTGLLGALRYAAAVRRAASRSGHDGRRTGWSPAALGAVALAGVAAAALGPAGAAQLAGVVTLAGIVHRLVTRGREDT
ncbi:hypothetical protein [Saccharomonospora sp. NB11]|uniref:hypothetical protein n=1 Tax=Saccharomonospora sp. NB11 TaxID=1642298 RepID=UPI0018CFFCC1|nr:hypothetical protein [Saccharomonospora sp. NB11]